MIRDNESEAQEKQSIQDVRILKENREQELKRQEMFKEEVVVPLTEDSDVPD